jgi:Ras-related protein Rab-2A
VLDQANPAELARYQEKVLDGLHEAISNVRKFDLTDPETAEPNIQGPAPILDIARLSDMLVGQDDFVMEESGGTLRTARHERTGQTVLVKVFQKPDWRSYMREVELLAIVRHPAVVDLVGWQPLSRPALIVTEFCPNGTLFDAIKKPRKGWTPTKQSMAIFGIACAMETLHKRGVANGELTCENVFLDDNFEARVGASGQPRVVSPWQMWTYAPETFPGGVTVKADVYSYGILLYSMFKEPEFLDDKPSCHIRDRTDVMEAVGRGARFVDDPAIPDFYWNLMNLCWKTAPEKRPTSSDIVNLLLSSPEDYSLPGTDADQLREYERRVIGVRPSAAGSSAFVEEFRSRYLHSRIRPDDTEPLDLEDAVSIIVLGDAESSKDELIRQFMENHKTGARPGTAILKIIKCQTTIVLMDTTGHEARGIISPMWRRADGVLVVYDVGRRETFDSLGRWLEQIRSNARPEIPVVICANEASTMSRQVTAHEGHRVARRFVGASFVEVATTTGSYIQRPFEVLAMAVVASRMVKIPQAPGRARG